MKVLLQSLGEKRYRGLLAEFAKKKFVPIEESYQLVMEFKGEEGSSPKKKAGKTPREREVNETLAILCKRQG